MSLTQSELQSYLSYDPEAGVFTRIAYCSKAPKATRSGVAGGLRPDGYRTISVLGKRYLAHRLAWLYVHGEWPPVFIDHINGDPSDNRIVNLRPAERHENCQNRHRARRTSKTGVLGVAQSSSGKFVAYIQAGGKNRNLGTFDSPEAANAAYVAAKRELHPFSAL